MTYDQRVVLDPFTRVCVRRKSQQLVRLAGFTTYDFEDFRQELFLRVIKALPRFDPGRAHHNVFVTVVVERGAAMIVRRRRAGKRDSGPVRSLDTLMAGEGIDSLGPTAERPRGGRRLGRVEEERSDLAIDVGAVVATLSADLLALSERLKVQSLSQVAREMGVPRSTLQRRVERLRRCFEGAGLRNYLGPPASIRARSAKVLK